MIGEEEKLETNEKKQATTTRLFRWTSGEYTFFTAGISCFFLPDASSVITTVGTARCLSASDVFPVGHL